MVGTPLSNLIVGNTITGTLEAGLITYSANTIIANNKVTALKEWREIGAFHVYRSHDVQILNNQVTGSKNGILLLFSPNNQIRGNRLEGAWYGVALFKSDRNSIENNAFFRNGRNTILLDSNSNTIRYNNFSQKQSQAYETGNNVWQANYWDDYSGADRDGDGVGDSAYPISGTIADQSPQMRAYPEKAAPVPQLTAAEVKDTPYQWQSIKENTIWENCNKELEGSLNIESGATLTIKNCVISASDLASGMGPLSVNVRPGGGLFMYNSTLKGDGLNSYFMIRTERGANLVIRDSKLEYAGDWGGGPGIQLFGDGAVIENNEIVGSYNGIDIRGSSGHTIAGNKISDCLDGIVFTDGATSKETITDMIDKNVVSGCFYPEISQVLGSNE